MSTCPRCGGPAYVGLHVVECAQCDATTKEPVQQTAAPTLAPSPLGPKWTQLATDVLGCPATHTFVSHPVITLHIDIECTTCGARRAISFMQLMQYGLIP